MICVKCGADVPDMPFCGACGWKQERAAPQRHRRGNGQGRVWKRGSTWYAQVTLYSTFKEQEDGSKKKIQRYRTRGGFPTKKAALAALEDLKAPSSKDAKPLLHYYDLYEANLLPKISKDRQTGMKKARERLDSIMGRKIDTLSISDLQAVVDTAPSFYTARDMKTVLSKCWSFALADQVVSVDLPKHITLPELEEKTGEPFTQLEVAALWKAWSDGHDFTGYILLMIYSGMMPGELLRCRVDQVDLEACEIRGAGLKTDKRKEVPIVFPSALRPLVESLLSASSGDKLLHINKDRFYDDYYAALESAGVRKLPPYSCRHTTGTEAARLNLSASVVQNIMRHAKITTTQRYVHLTSKDAHEGLDQLSIPNNYRTETPQTLVK